MVLMMSEFYPYKLVSADYTIKLRTTAICSGNTVFYVCSGSARRVSGKGRKDVTLWVMPKADTACMTVTEVCTTLYNINNFCASPVMIYDSNTAYAMQHYRLDDPDTTLKLIDLEKDMIGADTWDTLTDEDFF